MEKYFMEKYFIVAENPEKGISIMADSNGNFTAYVNGKHYDVGTGRPCYGYDGRQLREDSRAVIRDLLPAARENHNAMLARDEQALQAAIADAKPPIPKKSFAEVLEEQFLATLAEKSAADMSKELFPILEKMMVEKFGIVPKVHEIRLPSKEKREIRGVVHADFDKILGMTSCGVDFGVYFYGPAGTGKSYMAKQIADALGVPYWFTSHVIDDIQLKGFIDANGKYHETQFYKAFTTGGVFFFDEMDASCEESLVAINDALANGYFDFPNGRATVHPDFHALGAGNTNGNGADENYTSRRPIDKATLDRFAFIPVDYDREIEMVMADGNTALVEFARDFRKATEKVGTTCLCTYRAIKRLSKFSEFMSKEDALKTGLIKGLAGDDVKTIYNNMTCSNEWRNALVKLF